MFWIAVGFVILSIMFFSTAKLWEMRYKRPSLKEKPMVSILIPAYKSEKTINQCLESVRNLSYKNKEVIVVNDFPDKTSDIVKSFGFKLINNKKRQGKAKSLNEAAKKAKGEIFFFLDADTIIEKDCLTKVVPWFSKRGIGVVAPKYVAKNKDCFVPRLVSLENSHNSTMFKMHMFFGSMISFRGCGVAIRRDFFNKVGGWSHTLIEDTDFAAKTLHSGYKIQYEPSAVVRTIEPETFGGLKKQKLRWGIGAGFSIMNNKKAYANTIQSTLQFGPYVILNLIILYVLLQMMLTASVVNIMIFLGIIFVAVMIHNFILMWPERESNSDILYIPLYTLVYLPIVLIYYVGGIFVGIIDSLRHKPELDFKWW